VLLLVGGESLLPLSSRAQGVAEEDRPCIEATAVTPSESAFDVLLRSASCTNKEKYEAAARLLQVGNAFQHYDVQRIRDTTQHDAFKEWMGKTFRFYPQDERKAVLREMRRLAQSAEARAPICEHLRSMGPPTYTPKYMIKYGRRLKDVPDEENIEMPPPPEDFEASSAWAAARAYVSCSTTDE